MHLLYATDRRIDAYLVRALREAGHLVETTREPADVVVMAASAGYQAIVLDWSSPPAPCCASLAAASTGALLLVIAASGSDAERTRALKAGADACLERPVSFIELEARLEALERLMRRSRPGGASAAVALLPTERAVRVNGRKIALSAREFHLMAHLIARPGETTSPEQLQQHVWGEGSEPRLDLVRNSVSRLRRKLGAAGAGWVLRAVAGHGYIFEPGTHDGGERLAGAAPT
jgi:two-component system OmpR family response regulator